MSPTALVIMPFRKTTNEMRFVLSPLTHREGSMTVGATVSVRYRVETRPSWRPLCPLIPRRSTSGQDVIRSIFIALPPRIASFSVLFRNGALRTKSIPTGQSNG